MSVQREWLIAQFKQNMSVSYLVEAYCAGPHTEVGATLTDQTQPVANETTGYIRPVVQFRIPFILPHRTGLDDGISHGKIMLERNLETGRNLLAITEYGVFRKLAQITNEQINYYLEDVDSGAKKVGDDDEPKTHMEALTEDVQLAVDRFEVATLYDELGITLAVVLNYLNPPTSVPRNDQDAFRDRGIALYESMFPKFGVRYGDGSNHSPSEKAEKIRMAIEYNMLHELGTLRVMASLIQAQKEGDLGYAETLELPAWADTWRIGQQPQEIATAWARDMYQNMNPKPELLKSLVIDNGLHPEDLM